MTEGVPSGNELCYALELRPSVEHIIQSQEMMPSTSLNFGTGESEIVLTLGSIVGQLLISVVLQPEFQETLYNEWSSAPYPESSHVVIKLQIMLVRAQAYLQHTIERMTPTNSVLPSNGG
jgi:hypothetical protein